MPEARTRLDGLAVAVVLGLSAIWGVQQVASKVAITQGVPPMLQAVLRGAVAGPLLLGWMMLRDGGPPLAGMARRDGPLWPGLATAALFALEFVLLFSGVARTSASHAVLLLFTYPFFTALGMHLLVPGERMRAVHAAGLVIAFAGVAATVLAGGHGHGVTWLGDVLVLGGSASWAVTMTVVKASPTLSRLPPGQVLLFQVLGSLPLLVLAAAASGHLVVPDATALAWACVAYQCVIVTFASYLTWFWLVSRYPAGKLAAFTFVAPLVGVVAAWAFLGEAITPALLAGLAGVVLGLWLVNRV